MSNRSYNRGTAMLRRQTDARMPSHMAVMMSDLNEIPKADGAFAPFTTTTIQQDHRNLWWIAGEDGYGYWYENLRTLVSRWLIDLTSYDETTRTFTAQPRN